MNMQRVRRIALVWILTVSAWPMAEGLCFSFSEYEKAPDPTASGARTVMRSDSNCTKKLQGKKVVAIIGEQHLAGGYEVGASRYGSLVTELNSRLKAMGLHTFTPQEISSQIAQAEQEAVLANDLDAALSAAKRMNAQFTIRGLISTRTQVNRIVNIDEVFVTLSLTLLDGKGRKLSSSRIESDSFSGSDTVSTILTLIEKDADRLVAELYQDYCHSSAP